MIKTEKQGKAKHFTRFLTVFALIIALVLPVLATSCSTIITPGGSSGTQTGTEINSKKSTYDMSGVTFEGATFTYDGEAHSIYISGKLPEGVTVSYVGNERTEQGSHSVTAKFKGLSSYNAIPDMTAEMIIKKTATQVVKKDYDMSGIAFANKTVAYDGTTKSIYIEGTLPAGVTVSYVNNGKTAVGVYTVTANFAGDTTNYNAIPSMTATLTIEGEGLLTYDMSGVSFANKTVAYDGTAKSIEITGTLPAGVSVNYVNNGKTEAGTYTVTANFTGDSQHYAIPSMTATLIISSIPLKNVDMSGVSFKNATFKYDGTAKSIEITGTLPTGIKNVSYTNNNKTTKGTYTVTANFVVETGYNAVSPMTAVMTIEEGDTPTNEYIFVHNSSWSSAYVYVWNGSGTSATSMSAWPGTAMQALSNGYFYFDTKSFDTAYTNIIFNNGSSDPDGQKGNNQSEDLTYPSSITDKNCYDFSSKTWGFFNGKIVIVPTVSASVASGKVFRTESLDVTFSTTDAASSTYSIDGATPIAFTDSISLKLGEGKAFDTSITVKISASYEDGTVDRTFTYTKKEPNSSGDYQVQVNETAMEEYNLAPSIKDGEMLQCFVWSYDEIAAHAESIAEAGFTAIQTSPVQVCKEQTVDDGTGNARLARNVWMMYYQPAAFTVEDNDDSAMGNVESFVNMINVLHSYGIKVMVDVVANHLGNQWWAKYVCERAYYYEPEICGITDANGNADYTKIPDKGTYWNGGSMTDSYSSNYTYTKNRIGYNASALSANLLGITSEKEYIESWMVKFIDMQSLTTHHFHAYSEPGSSDEAGAVIRGQIGMPDLDTSDPVVQEAVADYLVELVNYGVDGFRFDASKHIETPSDSGDLASNFWPVVLTAANSAANNYDKELYYYGETINTLGTGRKFQYYTEMKDLNGNPLNFDITDFNNGRNCNGFTFEYASFKDQGSADQVKGHLVAYAEGHDTYMNQTGTCSSGWSKAEVNSRYISLCATKDVVPCHMGRWANQQTSRLGSVVTNSDGTPYIDNEGYGAPEVSGINQFRNLYNTLDAGVKYHDNNVVERYVGGKSNQNGICIMNKSGSVSISVSYMADGTYIDLVSGNTFTVSGGLLTGTVGASGVAAITAIAR